MHTCTLTPKLFLSCLGDADVSGFAFLGTNVSPAQAVPVVLPGAPCRWEGRPGGWFHGGVGLRSFCRRCTPALVHPMSAVGFALGGCMLGWDVGVTWACRPNIARGGSP